MSNTKEERQKVRVKPHSYQPSRADMDDPIIIRNPDGSVPTESEFVSRVLRPMKIEEDPDA